MNLPPLLKALLPFVAASLLPSCASRLVNDLGAGRIALTKASASRQASQADRLSALLPAGAGAADFQITRVDRVDRGAACGMGLVVTYYTLGLVPATIPAPFDVTVTGTHRGRVETRRYHVPLATRTAIWNWVIPPSRDDRILARGLLLAVAKDWRSEPRQPHPKTASSMLR